MLPVSLILFFQSAYNIGSKAPNLKLIIVTRVSTRARHSHFFGTVKWTTVRVLEPEQTKKMAGSKQKTVPGIRNWRTLATDRKERTGTMVQGNVHNGRQCLRRRRRENPKTAATGDKCWRHHIALHLKHKYQW
jgi:hypothetical protein